MNYLIVGLGNPGDKYRGTRHNIGFVVLDELAEHWNAPEFSASSQTDALVSKVSVAGQAVLLVKPTTFMNNSGTAVRDLVNYFDIPAEQTLVIYDDVDLPLADVRLMQGRGSGGHRGLQSVIDELDTQEFPRLRIGISPTDADGNLDKQTIPGEGINPFVMGQFSEAELEKLEAIYSDIKTALERWLDDGLEAAMNLVN